MATSITHLECSKCHKNLPHDRLQNLCACGGPLFARYDLNQAAKTLTRDALRLRAANMWRYEEVLPGTNVVSLGEGLTPLIHARRLGARLGLKQLFIKDEGLNPTGSFKARGLSAAVTRAKELGAKKLAAPSAGNAGGALAAYAAQAGIPCVIVMPADTPAANLLECKAFGADVRTLDGLISDCGRYVAERTEKEAWFDVSTLKEPYRIEGKKTMAYEVWEQFQGKLPDVIFYPTGGGVGLIGMWKAFEEMETMGWIGRDRPRMVSVQTSGCAPIVKAFRARSESAEFWENASTVAAGLRVPKPFGDRLILEAIRSTRGVALAVSDGEIFEAGRELAALEGIFAAPEGVATVAAARQLVSDGWIGPDETVVLFNTGSGYKYMETWQKALETKGHESCRD
jgi:threonine synthase